MSSSTRVESALTASVSDPVVVAGRVVFLAIKFGRSLIQVILAGWLMPCRREVGRWLVRYLLGAGSSLAVLHARWSGVIGGLVHYLSDCHFVMEVTRAPLYYVLQLQNIDCQVFLLLKWG